LIKMRGGVQALGMDGLLAGECLWCDNVTAFLSSSKPLLSLPEKFDDSFGSFEDEEPNLFFVSRHEIQHWNRCLLWNPSLKQVLPDDLIMVFQDLDTMTALFDAAQSPSEHDMLVYDRKRAVFQHELADIAIPPVTQEFYHIIESCRLAAIIYSIAALWGFRPPMKIYEDLAKRLRAVLQFADEVCNWDGWSNILLWMLFIGDYAAFGTKERKYFSAMIKEALQNQNLHSWLDVKGVLDMMPVCRALWIPFELVWWETLSPVFDGAAVGESGIFAASWTSSPST